ncbi:cap-pol fusion protein [Sclerotinia sclerotiorum botybirnavirus 1]|uniref:RNA-directed RNA polymerase n=1 Tax=Sclerotinia sclerotiorum botybirnavirus 1 TaxID=1654339 RepID=A0A0F7JL10_9VIRU|nr:cap-pol fusion protein [Sclerotinia sclerotiorum botybirnavirus 1]AKH14760.1 cap-pol fusion protein [Sclerotinia sclerotiorum botybirnavirus 1]
MSFSNNIVSVSALPTLATLPYEMWSSVVSNLSTWDAACIVKNIPMCQSLLYQALLARANLDYNFGCTHEKIISTMPCNHPRTCEVLPKGGHFAFVCAEHIVGTCSASCDSVLMSADDVYSRFKRYEESRLQRKRDHMYGPFALEHDMMVIDDQNAATSSHRDYMRYRAEMVYVEEDLALGTLFGGDLASTDTLVVERTRGGMDAAGSGAPEASAAAPTPVEDEVPQDGPVNEEPVVGLPPGSEEPSHPGPDVPLDPRVTNGDDFGNIPNTEDASDPVDAVATNGWFEYPYAEGSGQVASYAGLITQANPSSEYVTNISDRFRNISPQFEELERNIRVTSGSGVQSYLVQTIWGFGPRGAASLMTQSANADTRTVAFWTTNPQFEIVPVSEDTIMYDTLAGLSVEGQMVRLNTTFNDNMITDLYNSVGDRAIAQRYYDHVVTAAVAGSNYVAFLTICYTRLVALKIMSEQNQPAQMRVSGDTLNANILLDTVAANPVTRRVADAVLRSKPTNAVMLPHGSNDLDVETMLYLMGHGRVIKSVATDEDEVAVFSPFDRFHTDSNFKLLGVVGERAIGNFPPGNLEFQIDFGQAFDLLNRYINQNDLWDQFAIARNIALGMIFSRTFSSSVGLPKPYHSRDLALNRTHTGANQHGRRRVMEFKESFHAVVASGTWHCAAMEETLFESVVNVMEETAGIGPRAPNFYATIDTMQDDFDLEYKTAMVCLPVVERMTGTSSSHIHQYVSKSNVAFMKAISFGWESKPIRISSYLALEITPEDKNFKFLFDKSARTALLKQEKFTWREAVLTSFVCHSQWGPSEQHRFYGEFYDDNISDLREQVPFYGYLGRSQLEHLEGSPTIWNTSTAATPLEFTKPKSLTRVTRDLNEEEAMQVDSLWATMKAALEAASAENDAEEDEDDEEFEYPQPTANPTGQGQRFELHEPKGKEVERSIPEPEQQRAGTDRPIPASQWQRPKNAARVSASVEKTQVQARNYFQGLATPSRLIGFNQSTPTPEMVPQQRNSPLAIKTLKKVSDRQKDYEEHVYLDTQVKKTAAERRQFEQYHRGGMQKKANRKDKRVAPAQVRDEVEQLCSRMVTDLRFRTELLTRLPATENESKAVDFLYPRGKDGSLKRAVYTIGTLLRKLRCDEKLTATQKSDINLFLTTNVGGKNAWAVAVVMFISLNTLTPDCYEMLKSYGFLTTPYNQWNDKWSKINDLFRNQMDSETWLYSETDFPQCLYIAGFVGRPHREADWEAENAKRSAEPKPIRKFTKSGFVDMSEEDEKRMILDFLYSEATFRIKRVQGFERWYRSRAEWMIKGSMSGEKTILDTEPVVMAKLKDLGLKVDGHANKMHIAEKVDYTWMIAVLDMDPVHLAKMHTKGQENGKIRSIQGSCYSHYVFGNYWSTHLESTLTLKAATMNKKNSQLLEEKEERRKSSINTATYKVCADYPDFGATHSCRQQRLVLECILEVACAQGFLPDKEFLRIHEWYAKSFENQYWMRPDTYEWYRATTGMFSGVVQTTLINTVMNGALRRHYLKTLSLMGNPVSMLRNFELGDDGWAEFPSRAQAEAYIAVIPLCGKELNSLKQLISSISSEYLREWYTNGTIYGCASRALAMLVSGNVESNIASAGAVRLRELYESFSTLRLRHFKPEMCQYYFEDLAVYEVKHGKLGRVKVLRYLYSSRDQMGMGLYPIHQMPGDLQDYANMNSAEQTNQLGDVERAAEIIFEQKVYGRFKASRDYVDDTTKRYNVTWRHQGKARATATIAAQNVVEGNKTTQTQHSELEVAVLLSSFSSKIWEKRSDVLERAKPASISAREIEKQYFKATLEDQRLLSQIGQLAKIAKYMTEESITRIAMDIALENGIPLEKVQKAIRTLSSLKGEGLDYPPRPLLSQELMGIYSQWSAVDKRESGAYLPDWLITLAPHYRT